MNQHSYVDCHYAPNILLEFSERFSFGVLSSLLFGLFSASIFRWIILMANRKGLSFWCPTAKATSLDIILWFRLTVLKK
jgi:hypothetical protein